MANKGLIIDEKVEIKLERLDKIAIMIGCIGLLSLIIIPIIITQFNLFFDFSNTGQIGDTIGGLTAPIIGFFSTLLFYFSFRAQIKANYIVQSQIDRQKAEEKQKKELDLLMEVYNHIKQSFENFQYKEGGDLKTGSTAFHKFWSILMSGSVTVQHGSQKTFESIIKLFEIIVDKLLISKANKIDIELVLFLTELQFNQFIWDSLDNGKKTSIVKPNNSNFLRVTVSRIELIQSKITELKKNNE